MLFIGDITCTLMIMQAWQLDRDFSLGTIRMQVTESGELFSLRFVDRNSPVTEEQRPTQQASPYPPLPEEAERVLSSTVDQLREYFAGKRSCFDLAYHHTGGPFAEKVYSEVSRIPPGETRTYRQIAEAIGKPTAARAVAGALAANTLLIIIPCHRGVPSSGGVGNYRDGTRKKGELIALEKRLYGTSCE